jgi:hypothetical protein
LVHRDHRAAEVASLNFSTSALCKPGPFQAASHRFLWKRGVLAVAAQILILEFVALEQAVLEGTAGGFIALPQASNS